MIEFNNKRYEQKRKFYSWKLSINNHMRLQTHFSRKRSLKRNDVVLYSFPRIFARRTTNRPLIPCFWRHSVHYRHCIILREMRRRVTLDRRSQTVNIP